MHGDLDVHPLQRGGHVAVEVGDASSQGASLHLAVAGAQHQDVIDEVELGVKRAQTERDGRGGQPARGDVERHVRPLWLERAECQTQLADHLRVHVQGVAGGPPLGVRQLRPLAHAAPPVAHPGIIGHTGAVLDDAEQLRESYSRIAREYADHFGDELSHKPLDRALLDTVLTERPPGSTVADVGCGPGHVTAYLHDRGAPCVGVDVSPGMLEVARENNPGLDFVEGSLTNLPVADGSWGAIVALYSIIHLPPESRGTAFAELARALAPGGLLLVSFHVGDDVIHRDEMLGRPVALDFHMLNTRDVAALCEQAGLTVQVTLERRPHLAIEAPTTRGYVLAGKESTDAGNTTPE